MVPGAPALQIDFVRFPALSPFFIHYSLLFLQHPTPAQVYFRFNDFVYDVADNIKTFFSCSSSHLLSLSLSLSLPLFSSTSLFCPLSLSLSLFVPFPTILSPYLSLLLLPSLFLSHFLPFSLHLSSYPFRRFLLVPSHPFSNISTFHPLPSFLFQAHVIF